MNMNMNAEQFNEKLANDMKLGRQSLFLSSFEVTSEHEREVKECADKTKMRHLRFAVFFQKFFRTSNGATFNDDLRTFIGDDKQFKESWNVVFRPELPRNSPLEGDHRTLIKSKCWILEGESREDGRIAGDFSALWDCLRDAVDSYRDTGDVNSVIVRSNGDGRRRFVDLLFANDSVDRWEYCKLASLLADPDLLAGEEDNPWSYLEGVCRRHVHQSCRVDWYLRLDEDDDCAEYIVGLDNFPKLGRQERLSIGGNLESVSASVKSCYAFQVPWNEAVEVSLPPHRKAWRTLPDGASSCFQASASVPFGVFVRHRAASFHDFRRNWWRQQSCPVLLRNQSEFMICSLDRTIFDSLIVQFDESDLELLLPDRIETLWISNPDGRRRRETPFYCRRYRVNRRKGNDVSITVSSKDGDSVSIRVAGNRPFIERTPGNRVVIQTDNAGFFVQKAGEELSLVLRNAMPDESYRWMLCFDGETRESGNGGSYRFPLHSRDDGTFAPFSVACCDREGKTVDSVKGVVLPAPVCDGLLLDRPESCANNGWNATRTSADPIQDRIDGFRQYEVTSRDGDSRMFRVPVSGQELDWWFEDGSGRRTDLLSARDAVREIEPVEVFGKNPLFVCFPPDVGCPSNWRRSLHGEYWRQSISGLVRVEDFVYDPESPLSDFKLPANDTVLFRYRPTPARHRFCKDRFGRLGLFVPRTDDKAYDVVAYADDNADILGGGEVLASTAAGTIFTDFQDAWDGFRRNHCGADAFLIAFVSGTSHRLDFQSVANELKGRSGSGWFWTDRNGSPNDPIGTYDDKNLLNFVAELRERYRDSEESFPLRQTAFFRSPQTDLYESILLEWRARVSVLQDKGAKLEDATDVFRFWEDNGFCPVLKPDVWTAIRPWMEGTSNILWNAPDWWPAENGDWWTVFKSFVENCCSCNWDYDTVMWNAGKKNIGRDERSRVRKDFSSLVVQAAYKVSSNERIDVRMNKFVNHHLHDGARYLVDYVLFFHDLAVDRSFFGLVSTDAVFVKGAVRTFAMKAFQKEENMQDAFVDAIGLLFEEKDDCGRGTLLALALMAALCPCIVHFSSDPRHPLLPHDDNCYKALAHAFRRLHQCGDQSLWDSFCILELRCEMLIDKLRLCGH